MTGQLLDTMTLLRVLLAPEKLSTRARRNLEDGSFLLFYSTVNLWEIGVKMGVGGYRDLAVPFDWERLFPEEMQKLGAGRLEILPEDCRLIQDLPMHHRDPFDRMLIAQALRRKLHVVGSDEAFDVYGVERVW